MKIYFIVLLSLVIGVSSISAGGQTSFQPAIDVTFPIWSDCEYGISSGCNSLYTEESTGNVRYRFTSRGGTTLEDRIANASEIEIYVGHVILIRDLDAGIRLKSAVTTLRLWEAQAQQAFTNWDTYSNTKKDNLQALSIQRNGIFYGHFADLLLLTR